MTKQLVQVVNRVNNADIRKEKNGRGDEIYIVPSYTLPDDVVMNSGLYPASEIAKSYLTLEGTPAPIGHPFNEDGDYVSAVSEDGLNYFYAGVTNKGVRRVEDNRFGHRVYVEKHINIKTAMTSERGQRLIEAIENGDPIHTSTGLLLNPVESTGTNERGDEYTWIATDMTLDHDAILLDEEGAATPADGVGMMINHKLMTQVNHGGSVLTVNTVANEDGSIRDLEDQVRGAIQDIMEDAEWKWLADWGEDWAIIEADQDYYRVSWEKDENGTVQITGTPEPVKRVTMWESIQNAAKRLFNRGNATTQPNQEDGEMAYKKHIESALDKAGVDHVNMSEDQKMAKFEELMKGNAAQNTDGDPEPSQGELVANEKLAEMVGDIVDQRLKANQAEAEKAEREKLAETLKANKVELSQEDQDGMTLNALKVLVEASKPASESYGLPGYQVNTQGDDTALANFPE